MKSPGCQKAIFHNEAMDARSRDTRARHDAANLYGSNKFGFQS